MFGPALFRISKKGTPYIPISEGELKRCWFCQVKGYLERICFRTRVQNINMVNISQFAFHINDFMCRISMKLVRSASFS